MSGWTIVSAAAVTGFFTLGGVLLSSWSQTRSVVLEHDQSRRQQRLTAYREFLAQAAALERFMLTLSGREVGNDNEDLEAAESQVGSMLDAFPALYLVGAEKPCDAASELEGMALNLELGIARIDPGASEGYSMAARIFYVWDHLGGGARWGGLRDTVINEMREDVVPELGRLTTLDPQARAPTDSS